MQRMLIPLSYCCVNSSLYRQRNATYGIQETAVAVIADRTTFGFGYKLTNGWYARSDSTGRFYERTQTQSTQALLTKVHEVSE